MIVGDKFPLQKEIIMIW